MVRQEFNLNDKEFNKIWSDPNGEMNKILNKELNKSMDINKEIVSTKHCRVELDKVLQSIKGLDSSRETALAITKVQEGIMWLGMNLKRLGVTNPYPDSYNPDNTNVEPTADNLKF